MSTSARALAMSASARVIALVALIWYGTPVASALPSGIGSVLESQEPAARSEPFGRRTPVAMPTELSEASAKWTDLRSRILAEQNTIDGCRAGDDACPVAARRFLSIVELGRRSQGRARLGVINRAVNLSIKPASDWSQYGVEDFWSSPLATLGTGAGDCEDYAIVKYVALLEIGIAPDDLRLVMVRDLKHQTNHAVVAIRSDEQWLILDNRTLTIANAEELLHYQPLLVLDQQGVRTPATAFVGR
jgi:predicted transglutaminase-like cysteine proteinase